MRARAPSRLGLAVIAALAGAKKGPPRAPGTLPPTERFDQALASLPTCASTAGVFTIAEALHEAVRGQAIRIRGSFVYAPFCTAMACKDACCNKCRGSWELGTPGDPETPSL